MSLDFHTAFGLLGRGDLDAARRTLLAAQRLRAGKERVDADAARLLGYVCAAGGDHAAADYHLDRAGAAGGSISPDELALQCASALGAAGRQPAAAAVLALAARRHPDSAALAGNLAHVLSECGRLVECERVARQGVERWPDDGVLTTNLAHALTQIGRADLALPHWRRAFELIGAHPTVVSGYLGALNYADGQDPRAVRDEHARVSGVIAAGASAVRRAHSEPSTPQADGQSIANTNAARPLRVGLLSGDLNAHVVSFFAETVIEHAGPAQVTLCCYATSVAADAVAARLRKRVEDNGGLWRVIAALDDDAAARAVRGDRLDVLVDLSGHTRGGRPGVLALQPAPLQATWLGYPNTTGLTAVGWRIVDSLTDPPALGSDEWSVERPLRIDPCFLCYRPPSTSVPPQRDGGFVGSRGVTFGSFNLLAKLSDRTVGLWARLLRDVPGSRLLLKAKALADEQTRGWTLARFAAAGVDPQRVEAIVPTVSFGEHLAAYSCVDIALDPFPYHGTTTTCEALHMGVPVVTLAGGAHASRVGVSLLSAVGLPELIANTEADYLRIAAELAADMGRLAAFRSSGPEGLRARLQASPLCDGPAFARRWTAALRGVCGLPLR